MCQALSPASYSYCRTSFQSDHVIMCGLVECIWFESDSSFQMNAVCLIWLKLISLISEKAECFFSSSPNPPVFHCCCTLDCGPDMMTALCDWAFCTDYHLGHSDQPKLLRWWALRILYDRDPQPPIWRPYPFWLKHDGGLVACFIRLKEGLKIINS